MAKKALLREFEAQQMIRDMLLPGGLWNKRYKEALVNETAQSSLSPAFTRGADARLSTTTHPGSAARAGAAKGTRSGKGKAAEEAAELARACRRLKERITQ